MCWEVKNREGIAPLPSFKPFVTLRCVDSFRPYVTLLGVDSFRCIGTFGLHDSLGHDGTLTTPLIHSATVVLFVSLIHYHGLVL